MLPVRSLARASGVVAVPCVALLLAAACGGGGGGGGDARTPPTVSAVSPAAGAADVAPGGDVGVTFSEAMDCATLGTATFTLRDGDGNALPGTVTCSGSAVAFAPVLGGLPEGATVDAAITTGARNGVGEALASEYRWSFTTRTRAWSTAADVLQGSEQIDAPLVRLDAHGNAFALWRESSMQIRASRHAPGGGWTTANLSSTDWVSGPKLHVSPAGDAVAVWLQYNSTTRGNEVWASTYLRSAGSWSSAGAVDLADDGDTQYLGLAGDADGNVMLVWERDYASSSDLVARAYAPGSGWSAPTVIDVLDGSSWGDPAVAFVGQQAVVVWMQNDGTSDRLWDRRYTPGTGWDAAPAAVDTGGKAPMFPVIAAAPTGHVVVLWQNNDGRNALASNRHDPVSGWGTAVTQSADQANEMYELAMDAAGNAAMVWVQRDATLYRFRVWHRFYVAADDSWTAAAPVDDGTTDTSSPHVAMDPGGNAVVTWEFLDAGASIWRVGAARHLRAAGVWRPFQALETHNEASNHGLAMDARGGAVAVWRMLDDDGVSSDLRFSRLE